MDPALPASAAATARCRSCAGDKLNWITHHMPMAVPEGYPLSGDMAVLLCGDCGFVGNHSPSGADAYVDYYTRYNKHQSRAGSLHDLDRAYFAGVLDFIDTQAGIDWSRTDILDWGSGALLFSNLAGERGARSAHNYDMAGDYPSLDYGLIASTHCIEHVLDFNTEFRRIHDALGKDGLFLVATPDLSGYDAVYWGPYAAFDLEHINHFAIGSLTDALVRAGFSIVATRESERLVTPSLAYPEVLILARKTDQLPSAAPSASPVREAEALLSRYMSLAERDMSLMTTELLDRLAAYDRQGIAISPGLYGVASYAFRLVRILAEERDFHFSWLADSDSRLTGKMLDRNPIKDLEGFQQWVAACKEEGVRCVAFIAAVNAIRIEAFLKEHFGDRIDICILPPDCQNRAKDASLP